MKRGAIVLVPFPFTDLSNVKIRPALVVSRSDRIGPDVLLAFIGTYQGQVLQATDFLVEDSHPDFAQSGLKKSSFIRLDKLVAIDFSILLGELGELSASLLSQVNEKLRY